jgi:hypothetical protein
MGFSPMPRIEAIGDRLRERSSRAFKARSRQRDVDVAPAYFDVGGWARGGLRYREGARDEFRSLRNGT